MKTSYLLLLCLLAAGCSSISRADRSSSGVPAHASDNARPAQYHATIISEFSDGETRFLTMAPEESL